MDLSANQLATCMATRGLSAFLLPRAEADYIFK